MKKTRDYERQMNKDLLGKKGRIESAIRLKLFCDESSAGGWLYSGMLIVPSNIEAVILRDLLNKRCGYSGSNRIWGGCKPACDYHKKNNTEVHFAEVEKSKNKFFVAERWLDYLLNDTEKVFFYVLGIDLQKLDRGQFGSKRQDANIYNRFFRTVILKSVKSFFHRYRSIIIEQIYHDNNRNLETDTRFPWHSIFYIGNKDGKISFTSKKIKFIDSDHKKSGNSYSNFIQFVDLLLGCIHNCLDHTSRNIDKETLAKKSLPLIERLIKNPNNMRSQYKYFGRKKIEFFPKHDLRNLDANSLEYRYKKMDSFYTKRQLKIKNKNQTALPF